MVLLFDLEKAYDTTWKCGIMKDLHDTGLRGRLPNFISNFLSDRSFDVRIGSTLSDTFEKEQGIPQGNIISPKAKSALSLSITNLKIPHSDFKSNIHQHVMNKCQSVWEKQTENKLHELKPDFNSKCSFLGYSR